MAAPWEKYQALQSSPDQSADQSAAPWNKYAGKTNQSPGLLSQVGSAALKGLGNIAQTVDEYTGAPVRAGIAAAQAGNNPITAAVNQFGNPGAPTGKDIAANAGVSTEPIPIHRIGSMPYQPKPGEGASPAGMAGLGIDIASDPTTYIGSGVAGKAAGLIGDTKFGGIVKEAAAPALEAASDLGDKAKSLAAKVGGHLTGDSPVDIKTFMDRPQAISDIKQQYGNNIPQAVDDFRSDVKSKVNVYRQSINDNIASALKDDTAPVVSSQPMINNLEGIKSQLSAKKFGKSANSGDLDEISNWIGELRDASNDGRMNIQDLNEARAHFQKIASEGGAYKDGQFFPVSDTLSRAASDTAKNIRSIIQQRHPELADNLSKLADLHDIQSDAGNLLKEGKPDAQVLAAARGDNLRNQNILSKLSSATGNDFLTPAQDISATKSIGSPALGPIDTTGKALYRMASTGEAAHELTGAPGAVSGLIMTSPTVLKSGYNAASALANPQTASQINMAIQRIPHRPDVKTYPTLGHGK